MKYCIRCGAKKHKRIIEPFGINRPVMIYECRNAWCEYNEDDEPRYLHSRPR